MSAIDEFQAFLRSKGLENRWREDEIRQALAPSTYVFAQDSSLENVEREPGGDVPKAQADASGNIAAPGRIMVEEDVWNRAWHDQDAEGNQFVHFGIAVGPPADEEPVSLSAAHAPKGGVDVQGKHYPGGEFIPADVMAKATAEEKAEVEGDKEESHGAGQKLETVTNRDIKRVVNFEPIKGKIELSTAITHDGRTVYSWHDERTDKSGPWFLDEEEARKSALEHYAASKPRGKAFGEKWRAALTKEEVDAFQHYSLHSEQINRDLRAGTGEPREVKAMDAAMKLSALPKDTTLYRGLTSDPGWAAGDKFTDHAFVSTSLDRGVAKRFMTDHERQEGGGVMVEIRAKKGQKAADMTGLSPSYSESEILLPRKTAFRVVGIRTDGGVKIYTVDNAGTFDPKDPNINLSTLADRIETAAWRTDTDPTPAQVESGRYRKGRVQVHGLPVVIETPKGAYRRGIGKDGKPWERKLAHHYGEIRHTEAADGDGVDVFLGPHPESQLVFVVDQVDPETGHYDEAKTLLCFRNEAEAKRSYLMNYPHGWKGLGAITAMTLPQFREWLGESADEPAAE